MFCEAQERRIAQLESLNTRKEQQLMKLHSNLEEALSVLQSGQRMYGQHQRMLDAGQADISRLLQSLCAHGEGRGPAIATEPVPSSPSGSSSSQSANRLAGKGCGPRGGDPSRQDSRPANGPKATGRGAGRPATAAPAQGGRGPGPPSSNGSGVGGAGGHGFFSTLRGGDSPGRDDSANSQQQMLAAAIQNGDVDEADVREMLELMQKADELQRQLATLQGGGRTTAPASMGSTAPLPASEGYPSSSGVGPVARGKGGNGTASPGPCSVDALALAASSLPLEHAVAELLGAKDTLAEQLADEQMQLASRLTSLYAELNQMGMADAT